jgi:hypothetical protein
VIRHTEETIKNIMLKYANKSMFFGDNSKGEKC